jgi:hypothetical protein
MIKEDTIMQDETCLLPNDNKNIQNNSKDSSISDKKKGSFALEKEREENWKRLEDVPNHINTINLLLILGISIAIILFAIGLAILIKKGTFISIYLMMFSLLMMTVLVLAIYVVRWYQIKADECVQKKNKINPEQIDYTSEYSLMNIIHFLMMFFFILCLFMTVVFFGFQDYYLNPIRTAGMNQETWSKEYNTQKYSDVIGDNTLLWYVIAFTTLIISGFILASLIVSFKLIGAYRTWQTINEFFCITIFILGFVVLYYGVYCQKYRNFAKIDRGMPSWFPPTLIITAAITISLSILGFFGFFQENKSIINIFSYLSVFITAFTFTMFVSSAVFTSAFDTNVECKDLMDYFDQDFTMNNLGCTRKYMFVQNNLDNIQCPRDRIVSAWEVNASKNIEDQVDAYGCVDASCCSKTFHKSKKTLKFITLILFIFSIITTFITVGSFFMDHKLTQLGNFVAFNQNLKWLLVVIALFIVIILVAFTFLIPNPPASSPSTDAQVTKADNNKLTSSYVLPLDNNEIISTQFIQDIIQKNANITENKSNCTINCPNLQYYFELSSSNGVFSQNTAIISDANIKIINNSTLGNVSIIGFNGINKNLKDFGHYLNFIPNCPFMSSNVRIKVSATAPTPAFIQKKISFMKSNNIMIQAELKQPPPSSDATVTQANSDLYIINLSNIKPGQTVNILDKTVDTSLISKKTQIITGQVEGVGNSLTGVPLNKVSVKITPIDNKNCPTMSYKTNANGLFSTDGLSVLLQDTPAKYLLEINQDGYYTVQKYVTIGGLGWESIQNLGTITLIAINDKKLFDIKTKVFNSNDNLPLSSVKVYLYIGNIDFPNQKLHDDEIKPQVNHTQVSPFLKTKTDSEGNFLFNNITSNQYTLVLNKDGYYREIHCKFY